MSHQQPSPTRRQSHQQSIPGTSNDGGNLGIPQRRQAGIVAYVSYGPLLAQHTHGIFTAADTRSKHAKRNSLRILANRDVVKIETSLQKRDTIDGKGNEYNCYSQQYPASVTCTKQVVLTTTKTIVYTATKTATLTAPRQTTTVTKSSTSTYTSTTNVLALIPFTLTLSATTTLTTVTTTSTDITTTSTETVVPPAATFYAACANNNIASRYNGLKIFSTNTRVRVDIDSYDGLATYDCCVNCILTPGCLFAAQFVGATFNVCNVYTPFVPVEYVCDGSSNAAGFFGTTADPGFTNSVYVMDGYCGQWGPPQG
ncbi:hypothetical protein K402DRAFT_402783 [Aulographum hederae CBS 113979]|uniref:Apple domain-containing protein n=1 Tax=Aulographum hederae CBS 113979 TaxID=1176131 RepID=A0A6G1H6B0_9PEZI|nr:hypothetical protein K402DRAFT_402783 [Aulographum hederae CBS 113979]